MKLLPSTLARCIVLRHLIAGELTEQQIAEDAGVTLATVDVFVSHLRYLKMVHIASWKTGGFAQWPRPVYKLGEGEDAPRPKKANNPRKTP